MNRFLISIITPIYNCEEYLEESLNSIFVQAGKNKDIELIIVNDGSTDGTLDLCKKLVGGYRGDSKIISHMDNKGCGKCRNEAVRASGGKYVAIQDGDDISLLNRLEKQVEFLEKNEEIDFLGGHALKINEKGEDMVEMMDYPPQSHKEIVNMMKNKCMNPMVDPTMMFRRSSFIKSGGYGEKEDVLYVPDFDLWVRAIKKGYLFHNLQEPIIKYRVNSEGNTRKYQKEMIKQHMIVWRSFNRK